MSQEPSHRNIKAEKETVSQRRGNKILSLVRFELQTAKYFFCFLFFASILIGVIHLYACISAKLE